MADSCDSSVSKNVNNENRSPFNTRIELTEEDKTEKAVRAILIADTKDGISPISFSNLQEELRTRKIFPNKHDLLFCIAYVLMLEEGFIPYDYKDDATFMSYEFNLKQVNSLASKIPNNWKRNHSLYEVLLILKPFPNNVCKFFGIVSSEDLILNCIIDGIQNASYTMLTDPSMYIVSSGSSYMPEYYEQNFYIYQNLKIFSRCFKDTISNLSKRDVLKRNGVKTISIEDMPPELAIHINKFVPNVNLNLLKQ